jgi:hypothetical protein
VSAILALEAPRLNTLEDEEPVSLIMMVDPSTTMMA